MIAPIALETPSPLLVPAMFIPTQNGWDTEDGHEIGRMG